MMMRAAARVTAEDEEKIDGGRRGEASASLGTHNRVYLHNIYVPSGEGIALELIIAAKLVRAAGVSGWGRFRGK